MTIEIIEKLKFINNLDTDAQLALLLAITPQTLNKLKHRDSLGSLFQKILEAKLQISLDAIVSNNPELYQLSKNVNELAIKTNNQDTLKKELEQLKQKYSFQLNIQQTISSPIIASIYCGFYVALCGTTSSEDDMPRIVFVALLMHIRDSVIKNQNDLINVLNSFKAPKFSVDLHNREIEDKYNSEIQIRTVNALVNFAHTTKLTELDCQFLVASAKELLKK